MADSHPSSCTSWCGRETHVDQHPEQVRAVPACRHHDNVPMGPSVDVLESSNGG